jgi:two-component system, NarL family, nitrate/nitrite response regulator NarL
MIKILIADDHVIFRDGLRKLLDSDDELTVVGEAAGGAECIKMLAKLKPDILLLDLRMPDKSGLAVLEEVNFDTVPTRVIVLTAAEDNREVMRAMRLGARGVVLKQSATEVLLKSIHRVHAGEIWLDNRMTAEVLNAFSVARAAPPWRKAAPQRSREGNRPPRRPGLSQQRNRCKALHRRANRKESPTQHLRQARRFGPARIGALCDPSSLVQH